MKSLPSRTTPHPTRQSRDRRYPAMGMKTRPFQPGTAEAEAPGFPVPQLAFG